LGEGEGKEAGEKGGGGLSAVRRTARRRRAIPDLLTKNGQKIWVDRPPPDRGTAARQFTSACPHWSSTCVFVERQAEKDLIHT